MRDNNPVQPMKPTIAQLNAMTLEQLGKVYENEVGYDLHKDDPSLDKEGLIAMIVGHREEEQVTELETLTREQIEAIYLKEIGIHPYIQRETAGNLIKTIIDVRVSGETPKWTILP